MAYVHSNKRSASDIFARRRIRGVGVRVLPYQEKEGVEQEDRRNKEKHAFGFRCDHARAL